MARINRHILTLATAFAGLFFSACAKQPTIECFDNQEQETSLFDVPYHAPAFPEPDKSKQLGYDAAANLKSLFETTGPSIITSMGRGMVITDAQYEEIKTFTDNLVGGLASETKKYQKIFDWIVANVKYNHTNTNYSNDPYEVFKNKICVCQGYSNLLVVMCYSQGIPAVVVNGLINGMGHAWAYTCPDGVWEVSDPTNRGSWRMSNTQAYTHLTPRDADVDLFADDYAVYRYNDYQLNVDRVTTKNNPLIVPYSVGGFVIGSFNPTEVLPENIADIYIGENIKTFGETYDMRLKISNYGKYLQAIHIDENNSMMLSHKGVVYRKNGNEAQLYYIPGGMRHIEFLPMEKVEKETVKDHKAVTQIYFPKGTKEFQGSAIEKCPKLKRVYIPEDANWNDNALRNCPNDVEVIRGEPSSVKHVTM